MLQIQYQQHNFPFEFPFRISKGVKTHQPSLIISLSLGKIIGYGEATTISYYNISIEDMIAQIEKNRMVIERYALISPERFWHFLHHLFPNNNFLVSAFDMAAWDVWAQLKKQPLWQVLGYQWQNIPLTDYTIGINTPDDISERVALKPAPIYKLKLGSEEDIASLEALRKCTDAIIRIDANEAWTLDFAKKILPHLVAANVELIEQPFHRDDLDSLKSFRAINKIPIIADEACKDEISLIRLFAYYDGFNIKLSKCGGITPATRMIKMIKQGGKKVMLGGMCEHTVGATILAHLLPAADYADIDGPLLLKEPFGKGLEYNNGHISLPENVNGSGIVL